MSEADLREGLRAAVSDEPPLHFDADALIRRAETVRRRRRALVAVGVATAALTASVLSLPGVLLDRGVDAASGPVLTTTAPAGSGVPGSPPIPLPKPSPDAKPADRLSLLADHTAARVGEVVPEATGVRAEFTDTRKAGEGYVTGFVHYVDGAGDAGLTVQLSVPPFHVSRERFCADARCDPPRREPDGSHVEVATTGSPDHRLVTRTVAHFRVDGSVVQVSAYNYDPGGSGRVRDSVSVGADRLVLIATDPRLSAVGL